jgi:serine protease
MRWHTNALARALALTSLGWSLALPARAAATEAPMARVIVAFKADAAAWRAQPLSATPRADARTLAQRRASALDPRAGVPLTAGRQVGARSMVVRATGLDSATLATRLAAHPDVAYAVPDQRRRALAVPNDPLFATGPADGSGPAVGQWYLRAPSGERPSAVHALGAWSLVSGSPSIVVAVLDTGVLPNHPDLAAAVLPGYDLVDDLDTGNDGDGRDADASDPGDWITLAEDGDRRGPFYQCGVADSSWHGTQVAGIIGATANDGVGMAGTAHGVRILPVRVLGKCGGYDSDILAGMRWAVGLPVDDLPPNPAPARVLNLSLGAPGLCNAAYRTTIDEIMAPPYNAVVVAAAGNSTGHMVGTPANCPGVIGVVGLRHSGSKVGFSDLGSAISIAAPGGNCVNIDPGSPCLYPILTTANRGTRGPEAAGSIWTDSTNITVGTSFATPIVAGVAALVLSARPELTPQELRTTLQRTARPFPTSGSDNGPDDPTPVPMCRVPDGSDQLQCYCSTALCGAGMIDAAAAVLDATQRVPLKVAASQLLDFAEAQFADYFPGAAVSGEAGPFVYRYYPSSDTYLGVAVQSDSELVLNGVYVLGGPFGTTPLFVGLLSDFITPRATSLAAPRAR